MPYVERTVDCGRIVEHKKMFTAKLHPAIGGKKEPRKNVTEEAQEKVNERKAEEVLRWKLNANFTKDDFHVVLHYNDKKQEFEQVKRDLEKFFRVLRSECKKANVELKYIACTETKRMTNPHHHVILPFMDARIITKAWQKAIPGGNGRVSIKLLDDRDNHEKLAAYLIKESRSTMKRQKGKRRFTCSKGLITPEPVYRIIPSQSWKNDPKPKKGFHLWKDENGVTVRTGFHEISGYAWQEYFMVRIC